MKMFLEEHSDPCSHAAVFTDAVRQGIGGRTGEQISSHVEQLPSWSARELQQIRKNLKPDFTDNQLVQLGLLSNFYKSTIEKILLMCILRQNNGTDIF